VDSRAPLHTGAVHDRRPAEHLKVRQRQLGKDGPDPGEVPLRLLLLRTVARYSW
jgi:hypothetical protein